MKLVAGHQPLKIVALVIYTFGNSLKRQFKIFQAWYVLDDTLFTPSLEQSWAFHVNDN